MWQQPKISTPLKSHLDVSWSDSNTLENPSCYQGPPWPSFGSQEQTLQTQLTILTCVPEKGKKKRKKKKKKSESLHCYSTTLFWNRRLRREVVGIGRVLTSPVLLKLEVLPQGVHCQATLHNYQVEAEPLLHSLSLQVHACKHYSPQKIKLSLLQEPTFSPLVDGWVEWGHGVLMKERRRFHF